MSRRKRPASHKRWQCPGANCGRIYESPIPILDVSCNNTDKHGKGAIYMMKPMEDEEQ